MSKLTRRVLSMVMAVFMLISMISVFTLPAFAEEAAADIIDYDAGFETAFIINKDWTDEEVAGTDDLTITFRGEVKTVNPTTHKLFNSYDAAYDAAFESGNYSAENYLTEMPIFVFGPGDYSAAKLLTAPAPVYVWGANAGISPNADVAAEDRDIAWFQANGKKWPVNEARGAETILPAFSMTTRIRGTTNECAENDFSTYVDAQGNKLNTEITATHTYSDADSKWQYFLDTALKANPDATIDLYVDGVTTKGQIQDSCTDVNKTYYYQGTPYKATATAGRTSTYYIDNCINAGDKIISCWNTSNYHQYAIIKNMRSEVAMKLGDKYFDEITIVDSYFAGMNNAGTFFTPFVQTTKRLDTAEITIDKCVIGESTGDTFWYNADSNHKGMKSFDFNLTNSLLYNAGKANYGYFNIRNNELNANYGTAGAALVSANASNEVITFNVQDNIIYHDRVINAETGAGMNNLFNGNQKYIGGGMTNIKFNGNRVIGTVKNIPPNTSYTVEQANLLMNYDFSGNFFSTSVDGIGKDVVFAAAPNGNVADSTWDWDWTAHTSYYDYDMEYGTGESDILDVDAGEDNATDVVGTKINIDAPSNTGVITADSFTLGSDRAAVEISKTADFAELIDEFDISTVVGDDTFYVRSFIDTDDEAIKAASTKVYTATVVCIVAPSFNEALANGVEFGGQMFYADNTVVIPDMDTVITNDKFYAEVEGTLYQFEVDNVNVFPYQIGSGFTYGDSGLDLRPARATAENGNVLLIGSFYDNLIISYPTNIYGTNAGIDPVDKSNATVENNFEAPISADWDMNGTTVDKIMVREDINGTVKIDGVTIQETVYDNKRAGKDYATFDFVLENIVANELVDGKMDNTAIIMGSNPRNQNSTDHEFGKIANDSLTLRNFYIKTATTNQVLHENSAHTVVIDNMYCDITAAKRNRDTIAFFKGHTANYNFDVTVMNSIFTNGGKYDICLTYDGDRNVKGKFAEGDGHNYNFTATNNIFNKVGVAQVGGVATGTLNSLTVTDNQFYAQNANQLLFRLNSGNALCDADNVLIGNMTITGNKAYGYADLFQDFNMGENNPVYADGFVKTDMSAAQGNWVADMKDAEWFIDEDLTVYGSDFYVDDISGGSVENLTINNEAAKISFDMREGTTEEVEVYARNYDATYFWSTDAEGENIVDVIDSAEFTQALEVYYLTIEANGYSRVYEVSITAFDPLVFAEDYEFEEGYFGSDAVLIDENVATLATDSTYYAMWQGTPYAFVVGVNVVANISDTDALDVLVKSWAPGTEFVPTRSINLYSENYNVNPNYVDGYGLESPSHGEAWAYNVAYDEFKLSVKNVVINAGVKGKVAMYGFNIQGHVSDYKRAIGDNLDLHFENVLFTGEALVTGEANGSNTRYLFSTSNTAQLVSNCDQTDALTVKNMHVNIPIYDKEKNPEGKTARLIGEPMYATVEFDGLYVDEDVSAFNEWNVFAKHSGKNSSFTIKNSCLLNMSNPGSYGVHFEGMRLPADYGSVKNDLPEGYTNTLTYDNNIITGGFGHTSGTEAALIWANINSFSGVSITNNYLASDVYTKVVEGVETEVRPNLSLFWVYGIKGKNETLKLDVEVVGNVINGGSRRLIMQESDSSNIIKNANWTIADNTIFTTFVEDTTTAIADRQTFFYDDFAIIKEDALTRNHGILTEVPTFKLDVAGEIATNEIHEMTAPEGVVIDEETKTVTSTLAAAGWTDKSTTSEDGATTYKYQIFLTNLINNPYHNYIQYKIGNAVYTDYENPTITVAEETDSLELTATVYSPDGTVVGDTYTIVIADAPAHNLEEVPGVEATCTTDGYKKYYACTDADCGLFFEDAEGKVAIEDLEAWLAGAGFIPASHALVDVEGKDATCTEDGYTAHKACANCDYKEGYEVIPAGHKWADMSGEDATCTEDGFTAHKMCTVCFETEGKEVIPAGHTWGDYVYNEDATTEADGTETRTCSACGETETRTAEGTKLPEEEPKEPQVTPDERLPKVELNEAGNGVAINMLGSWATRVYWGYIGEEEIPYTWFDDFRLGCGTDYVADFTPRADSKYYFTKAGYYRFVLKCIQTIYPDGSYGYKDMVYTFYYDGKAKVAVPSLTMLDDNTVQINKNSQTVKKLYYGNIGNENEPYGWFNDFWGKALGTKTYTVDYSVSWNETYKLPLKGFYNFVIVYTNADGKDVELVYTVEAKNNVSLVKKDGENAVVDLAAGMPGGTINKLYYGNIGTEYTEYTTYEDFVAQLGDKRVADFSVTDGKTYALTEAGYYRFVIQYKVPRIDKAGEFHVYDVVVTIDNN